MLKAYVGVASKQGLSVFQPERDDSLSLVRQSVLRGIRQFGFWAIVNDVEALSIQALFLGGHCKEAMFALDQVAHELGPIIPAKRDQWPHH